MASDTNEVRSMYDATAESYAKLMQSEIQLPVYGRTFERLRQGIAATPGIIIDTSCGSGDMLAMYHEQYESGRPLLGIDLSPRMVEIAANRLGAAAEVIIGDMRDLETIAADCAAAVISFFAIHHLDTEGVSTALDEWYRVLVPGGRLILAGWEGTGDIDYGSESTIIARRFEASVTASLAESAGFTVTSCLVETVAEMHMDAFYIECIK